jgi:integrase
MNYDLAKRRAIELANQIEQGAFTNAITEIDMDECRTAFIQHLENNSRADKTIVKYKKATSNFLKYVREQHVSKMSRVQPIHFDRFRTMRMNECTAYSVYTECVIIKQFFVWAYNMKLIPQNQLIQYRLCQPVRRQHPSPSYEEVDSILPSLAAHYYLPALVLACTGMRSNEVRHLRPKDVDLKNSWIHIVSRSNARTKSQESRKVPIHRTCLLPMLQSHRPGDEWYFTMPPSRKYPKGGHWLNTKKMNEAFLKAVKKAGLKSGRQDLGYTIHSLRHFLKTHAINNGVPLPIADLWVGHRVSGQMNNIYYRLSDEESQKNMNKLPLSFGAK